MIAPTVCICCQRRRSLKHAALLRLRTARFSGVIKLSSHCLNPNRIRTSWRCLPANLAGPNVSSVKYRWTAKISQTSRMLRGNSTVVCGQSVTPVGGQSVLNRTWLTSIRLTAPHFRPSVARTTVSITVYRGLVGVHQKWVTRARRTSMICPRLFLKVA